jgi:dTDP-4-amino-4,6-dideoxygalactose transaminase
MLPFIDLQSQYRRIAKDVEERVLKVLRSGQYILGPEVRELESALAQFAGTRHCVSCASGTDALLIALMAKEVRPGDAVFCPSFTFFATAEVVALLGATPVFVDVEADSFNIDPVALERAIRALQSRDASVHPLPRGSKGKPFEPLVPRGIIAVDLFGLPAEYGRITEIAARYGLFVIEDAAQSFGSGLNGRRAGSLAEVGCASFFPAKPLGCYGDGGALFTDDDELAATFRSIRVHGQGADRYENVRLGLTGRLDTIQAAVLMAKLAVFDDELQARDRIARIYAEAIGSRRLDLKTPVVRPEAFSAWAQYSVLARDTAHRERCRASLEAAGIPTMIYYPKPLHLQTAFADLHHRAGDYPVSEDAARRIFSLPIHPYLENDAIRQIVGALV